MIPHASAAVLGEQVSSSTSKNRSLSSGVNLLADMLNYSKWLTTYSACVKREIEPTFLVSVHPLKQMKTLMFD